MEARLIELGPLPDGAVIWDVGAYKGDWSRDIKAASPDAHLTLYEPVPEYHDALRASDKRCYGLSDRDGMLDVTIAGDRSSTYEMGHQGTGKVLIMFKDVAGELMDRHLAVMKINVEGAEYPILERLLATDKVKQVGIFLIQFHTFIPNFGERYLAIKQGLSKTHNLVWRTPFVWERWDRK